MNPISSQSNVMSKYSSYPVEENRQELKGGKSAEAQASALSSAPVSMNPEHAALGKMV